MEKKGDGAKPAVPDPKADKPKLLGWAIVENQTDNDWGSVQLSLVTDEHAESAPNGRTRASRTPMRRTGSVTRESVMASGVPVGSSDQK